MIEIGGQKHSIREVARAIVKANVLRQVVNAAVSILRSRLEYVEDRLLEAVKLEDELYFAERELEDANNTSVTNK